MRLKDHRLYLTWKSMKSRCYNPNVSSFPYYGGRGIIVCDRWLCGFWDFVADVYPSFEEGLTLDRINFNGMYEPSNCRWATATEQANNQNKDYTSILYKGCFYTESQLSRITGVPRTTLQARRRKGWNDSEIVQGKDFRKYTVQGEKFNLKGLAEYLGSYPQQILRRLKNKTLEEVVHEFRGI